MQYYLCPRCKFRVIANKHICQICGHTMPSRNTNSITSNITDGSDAPVKQKTHLSNWSKFLGLGSVDKQKESTKEKPALG